MKRLSILILLVLLGYTGSIYAQKSLNKTSNKYEIKFKIKGIHDTVVYIGHHFGEKKYVIDTIQIDATGAGVMSGDKEIHNGIYLVVMPSRKMVFFEFLMCPPNERFFSIETDTANFVENMKIKGSKQNIAFNQYQREMAKMQKEKMNLDKQLKEVGDNKEKKDSLYATMKNLNERRIEFMTKIEKENEGTLFGSIIKSMHEVEIPDFPRDEQGNITDSTFQYKYYKKHYFDYIDFNEEGLIRTPIYEAKLDYFFEKMVVPDPDSIIPDAHKIINLTYEKGDTLVYQYTLSHLLSHFEESKIMGYDAVFVAIAEDWYLSGKAPWADSSFMSKLKERVEKITPTRLGSIAYNLTKMQSNDDRYYSLHDIKSDFTVLVYFEPNCGHCQKEIPKLVKEYNDTLKDLGVKIFSIYTQYDKEEWTKFIDEKGMNINGWINVWDGPYPHSKFRDYYDIYSTPVIYVLDKNKKIIGKRLNVENIKSLILFEKNKEEHAKKSN